MSLAPKAKSTSTLYGLSSEADCAQMSYDKLRQLLAHVREASVRVPSVTHACVMRLVRTYPGKLGNEIWNLYEEGLLASLDCQHLPDAEFCWAQLARRFTPSSARIRRLRGLILEARQDYEQALQCYKSILEGSNNCDQRAFKRKVAVYKARGDRSEAITTLLDYLKIFQTDVEGYHELADLYLADLQYARACACLEDMLLSDPENHLFLLRYAEALYSAGGKANLLDARKYFAQSLRCSCDSNSSSNNNVAANVRACFGVWVTCGTLAQQQYGLAHNAENVALLQWSGKKLLELYASRQQKSPWAYNVVSALVQKHLPAPSAASSSSGKKEK